MFTIALVIILGCLVLVEGRLAYLLLLQNGRILLRLDAVERQFALPSTAVAQAERSGLTIGLHAPEFELPNLSGGRGSLSQYRGRQILLIFFNPRCGFCARMAPDLARLPIDGIGGRPIPLIVTTGDIEETRKLFEEHEIRCLVLVQEHAEVGSRYMAEGTPMGYLIDAEGRIASDLAAGAEALLALASHRATLSQNGKAGMGPAAQHQNGHASKGNSSIRASRIDRDGLPAGTRAPIFRLPGLDGGEVTIEDFRGRKVLLVFSDPNCGPCDALAPKLEDLSHASSAIQVLMVSRGDAAENREKARQHGITFPVALQKKWEVSKLYAMFATPIAYLIDEKGIVASEVAVGVEPILDLLRLGAGARDKEVATMR